MLNKIIPVIKKAGKSILNLYNKNYQVFEKQDKSPVTEADLIADKIILEGLKEFGYPILSEESKDDLGRLKSEYVWIVDSLDGTRDFLDKTGEFCIMIGLSYKGESILGVLYQPTEDKLYFAEKGKGAYLSISDSEPIRLKVSSQSNIHDSILIVSRSHISKEIEDGASKLDVKKMQKCGSNGIKMGLIAEGKADIFFNPTNKLGQWDCCAPQIIIEEAGGKASGIHGEKLYYNTKNIRNPFGIAVSNGILHDWLIKSN